MMRAAVAAIGCAALCGCSTELEPGKFGDFRYVGQVRGPRPLPVVPPFSDRDGNAYIIYGGIDLLELELFVGHRGGGWTGGCNVTHGNDFGAHGFTGRAQSKVWYWSGEAFAVVSGDDGRCHRLLEFDPASGARLNFRAVVPWVRDTPSTTTALAWIQSPTDPVPFQVVLDLNNSVYNLVGEFQPNNAENLAVLGVGGRLDAREGVIVVRFEQGGSSKVQARFLDGDGETTDTTSVAGLETLTEYGILGYLQGNSQGLYAGLDNEGQLIVLDRSGGQRRAITGMDPVGVHSWDDQLFLVGTSSGQPVIAAIDDDGDVGKVQPWDASADAAADLKGNIDVIDDRSLPSSNTTWSNPLSAASDFPFLHPHSPELYAEGTTTWVVSGPSFTTGGGEERFSIAYAPVGVSYP